MNSLEYVENRKSSEYEVYKPLKYQEMMNYKNKYDNRLYFSMRFKNYSDTGLLEEIFSARQNSKTIMYGMVNSLFIFFLVYTKFILA